MFLGVLSIRAFSYSTVYTPSFGQQAEAMPKLFGFYYNTVLKSTALTR